MVFRTTGWIVCIISLLAGSWIVAGAQSQEAKKDWTPPPFKPVNEVKDMMEGQDAVFDNIKAAVKASKWSAAIAQAFVLAELGNVNVQNAKEPAYAQFAQEMSKKSLEMAGAFKKKDSQAARAAVSAVAASCKACHDKYNK